MNWDKLRTHIPLRKLAAFDRFIAAYEKLRDGHGTVRCSCGVAVGKCLCGCSDEVVGDRICDACSELA